MTADRKARYPSHPWGQLAADPCSPLLDPVVGIPWEAAVEAARQMRLASTRTSESLVRLQRERQSELSREQPGRLIES